MLRLSEGNIRWEVNGTAAEVHEVIGEYAFAKLSAALGVGVQVGSPDHPFEVICYSNCIEFFMEKCRGSDMLVPVELPATIERVKYCVAVMHHFGLIHKDIKPQNVLINARG